MAGQGETSSGERTAGRDDETERDRRAVRRWPIALVSFAVGALLVAALLVVAVVADDGDVVAFPPDRTMPDRTTPDRTAPESAAHEHADAPGTAEQRPSIVEFGGVERHGLGEQLVTAREVALRLPTLADAEAAGFVPTTPYAPGTGAHMGRPEHAQPPGQPLDLQRPQSYLYDGTAPESRVIGLMYVQLGGDEPPDGFIGPLDRWSPFRGQCLVPGTMDPVFPAAESVSESDCVQADGQYLDVTAWIQHVWVVPGWEAPGGVFAPLNDDIVCADGTTDSDPVLGCDPPTSNGGTP